MIRGFAYLCGFLVLLKILGSFFGGAAEGAVEEYAAMHPGKIVMYGAQWCSACRNARNFMDSKKIPYVEYDIEDEAEGTRQYDNLGGGGIPVMIINNELVRGFRREKVQQFAGT